MGRPTKAPSLSAQLSYLAELAEAEDCPTVDLPIVEILLSSGVWISGKVASYTEGESVLLCANDESRLVSIVAKQISAVAVDDDPGTELLFGTSGSAKSGAPTQLQLKRRVKALEEKVSARLDEDITFEIPWDDLPSGDVARADLNQIVGELDGALLDIASDGLGREALATVEDLQFQMGANVGAERDGAALIVKIRAKADRLLGPEEMRSELEAAL